jgi:hypothetical protein
VTERAHRTQGVVRYLGAAALLGVGIDHIQQYFGASLDSPVITNIGVPPQVDPNAVVLPRPAGT